jgi:hypothetical protein
VREREYMKMEGKQEEREWSHHCKWPPDYSIKFLPSFCPSSTDLQLFVMSNNPYLSIDIEGHL